MKLFGEPLPVISLNMVTAEYEARTQLAQALHALTFTEALARVSTPRSYQTVQAKAIMPLTHRALQWWIQKRRVCRNAIFANATITQECQWLVDSSPWGEHLFPSDVIEEVKKRAMTAGHNLFTRWGIPRATAVKKKRPSYQTP